MSPPRRSTRSSSTLSRGSSCADGVGLMNIGTRNHIIFYFFAAPGLLHYWVDGHIWKVRSDPELRTYLQL